MINDNRSTPIPPKPIVTIDKNIRCRGCYILGTACGKCYACAEQWEELFGDSSNMEPQNYKHLDRIMIGAEIDIPAKYKKGQQEHGGNLDKKGIASLIAPEIRAEAIDLIVYSDCLTDGLNKIRVLCVAGMENGYPSSKHDALSNIMKILDGEIQE